VAVEPSEILRQVEHAYHERYEHIPTRASVTFLGVEQIEVLRYRPTGGSAPGGVEYLTLGMSRYPMVPAQADHFDPSTAPRAELLLSLQNDRDDAWRRLAVLAAAPAVESAVYEPGNRVDLGEPWCAGSRCTGAVVVSSEFQPVPVAGLADVQVLRVLPAQPTELAWARVHGSVALLERWAKAATELDDLLRDAVELG